METTRPAPPKFTIEHRDLVFESWHYVERHVDKVGITAFKDLFTVSPESKMMFQFLPHYDISDDAFSELISKHSLRILGMVTKLVKELKSKNLEDLECCIHDTIFPLGRKHVEYGSNVKHMEILGLLLAKSLLKAIPKDEVGEAKYEKINEAYLVYFKVIVYWLQFGYNFQKRCNI